MVEAPRDEHVDDVDDAFRAVLEGLRTTLPGVQVLFAFLLIFPLQTSFDRLADPELVAFNVAFFGSALASILLIAPSAHQRIRAPISGVKRRSARHLQITVRITIVGTIIFAVALAAAVYLVSSLVLSEIAAVLATIAVTALLGWSWFFVPLVTFAKSKQ
ncbi:MAG TPA: DUF6328 family protein [Acidimicrobiia bacterium]|nr:DUF6328 family protein [Acidimicrobiia bacterium]